MPLTPNDILQKRFASGFRGLVADEVYAYLRSVADEMERLVQEATDARDALGKLEDQIEEYRHMEATLRNTLVSSQKVSQEIRGEAEHRAELIVREAELEAARRLQETDGRRQGLEEDILRLVAQRRRFEAEFAALIETHTRLLHHNHGAGALDFDEAPTQQLAFDDMPAEGAAAVGDPEPGSEPAPASDTLPSGEAGVDTAAQAEAPGPPVTTPAETATEDAQT